MKTLQQQLKESSNTGMRCSVLAHEANTHCFACNWILDEKQEICPKCKANQKDEKDFKEHVLKESKAL